MPAKTIDRLNSGWRLASVPLKISLLIRYFGLTLYVISYFVVAVDYRLGDEPLRGYACAILSLPLGFMETKELILGQGLPYNNKEAIPLLVSGLINPVFWTYGFALWLRKDYLAKWMALIVAAFAPACWVAFHYERMSPRAGYWLWTFGMFLVICAPLARQRHSQLPPGR